MNKSEKAIVSILAAQLEVLLASADAAHSGKSGVAFARRTAGARQVAEQYRKALGAKARPKSAKHR
jgi:hypothetical protein